MGNLGKKRKALCSPKKCLMNECFKKIIHRNEIDVSKDLWIAFFSTKVNIILREKNDFFSLGGF